MRKLSYLRFLPFCFAITPIAELNPTYATKALSLDLYKIEEKNPIDFKRMAISVLILPSLFFLFYIIEIISPNKQSKTSEGTGDFVIYYTLSSIINGIIFYYSFKIKTFGEILWGIKVIIRSLLFGLILCLSESLVTRKNTFDDCIGKSIKVSIFQAVMPYLFYVIITRNVLVRRTSF